MLKAPVVRYKNTNACHQASLTSIIQTIDDNFYIKRFSKSNSILFCFVNLSSVDIRTPWEQGVDGVFENVPDKHILFSVWFIVRCERYFAGTD